MTYNLHLNLEELTKIRECIRFCLERAILKNEKETLQYKKELRLLRRKVLICRNAPKSPVNYGKKAFRRKKVI